MNVTGLAKDVLFDMLLPRGKKAASSDATTGEIIAVLKRMEMAGLVRLELTQRAGRLEPVYEVTFHGRQAAKALEAQEKKDWAAA